MDTPREIMTKRRHPKRKRSRVPGDPDTVHILTYEITDEPILDRQYRRLPKKVKDSIERLHDSAQNRPREAIPELLEWIEKYPNIPLFYNYLSVAYSRSGEHEKAEEMIRENYRRNPDYLFARLNYGELCLTKRDYDQIPDLFDHKFDLKLFYPKRRQFHISEVLGFMGLLGAYFFEIGEREVAQKYYEVLEHLDPDHMYTRRLRSKLFPGPFRRILSRLARQP
jgi:tetratricopeptide (TPR) repeat protein